jgi:hypothetical protein
MFMSHKRAPHGLVYQNSEAFSPLAYEFFHSNSQNHDNTKDDSCKCAKLDKSRKHLGAGSIVGINNTSNR